MSNLSHDVRKLIATSADKLDPSTVGLLRRIDQELTENELEIINLQAVNRYWQAKEGNNEAEEGSAPHTSGD